MNVETQSVSVASEKKNNIESTSFFHKVNNRSIKKSIIDIFNLEIQMNFVISLSYRINSEFSMILKKLATARLETGLPNE